MPGCSAIGKRNDVGVGTVGSRERSRSRSWWIVAGLLITAFLARTPLYLSVFPPFEGWDEYQHLGYIAYLEQTSTIPVFSSATRVPLAIRPLVIAMPHSRWGGDQVRDWGALSYGDFWNAPAPTAATDRGSFSSPRLYQAQHPPLAYALDVPIWHVLKRKHPLDAIYAIRTMNLLLAAIGLVLFAGALERLMPILATRVAVLALVCLHPLFFQNVARVANDALALATGIGGISLLVLADRRTLLTRGLMAAACIAASVWSKQTGLTLIPVLVLGLPLIGWVDGVPAGRLCRVTAIVTLVLLLLVAPLWLWSYRHYGAIITTQESLQLASDGPVAGKLVASLEHLRWPPLIDTLFVPGRPWVGGWSFLPMQQSLADLYGWYWRILLAAAVVGGVVAMLRGRSRLVEPAVAVSRIQNQAAAGLAVCCLLYTSDAADERSSVDLG